MNKNDRIFAYANGVPTGFASGVTPATERISNTSGNYGDIDEILFKDFSYNGDGGAILNRGSNVKIGDIINSEFINNKTTSWGGAINNYSATIGDITGSTFLGNSGFDGVGISNNYSAIIGNILKSEFLNNKSPHSGGAILNYYSTIGNITKTTFANNTLGWVGGAICNEYSTI